MPELALPWDLPWRLLIAVVAAGVYVTITRWSKKRSAAVYELRGV